MNRLASAATALALICIAAKASAQDDLPVLKHTHIDFGPKVGVNLSKLDGESWDGGYKTNLLGGVFLSVHGERFGIQAEGLFSQTTYTTGKDFKSIYHAYLNPIQDSITEGHFRLSYFNIPIMVEVRILNRVWLQVGPQYSGVVSVEDKDAFAKDAEGLFKKGVISGVGGLSIQVTRRINAGARYVMGFTNLNENYDQISQAWKQRNVQLHLGLTF